MWRQVFQLADSMGPKSARIGDDFENRRAGPIGKLENLPPRANEKRLAGRRSGKASEEVLRGGDSQGLGVEFATRGDRHALCVQALRASVDSRSSRIWDFTRSVIFITNARSRSIASTSRFSRRSARSSGGQLVAASGRYRLMRFVMATAPSSRPGFVSMNPPNAAAMPIAKPENGSGRKWRSARFFGVSSSISRRAIGVYGNVSSTSNTVVVG
jgi:hypothetical protein